MSDTKKNWVTVADSQHAWERDALDFVRDRWPDHEPYRAWANFEFIALDGSINEVDLLLLAPMGFFLVEIKSRPGRVFGDPGTWTWDTEGRLVTATNPLLSANLKAKKLKQLLQRQKAVKVKDSVPFIEPLVFLSAPEVVCELRDTAAYGVSLRDRDASPGQPERPGILAAVRRRDCPGLPPKPGPIVDRPLAKMISQAIEQAGIPSQPRQRRVSDYVLERLIEEGPGYQDWEATHAQNLGGKRRVRLYLVWNEATADDRRVIERAARRDFQLTEALQHPGVLRALGFTEHEVGPAIVFEHDPNALRLDHFLTQRGDRLGVDARLDLMRQVAEVVRFAHQKKVVHRALCPQSVLVCDPDGPRPRVKLFNWQVGYRAGGSASGGVRDVTATSHVELLVEDARTAYMAPEADLETDEPGEHLDVFSLGAIAYHAFAGVPPAGSSLELADKLRQTRGLQISDALNGASKSLQELVQFSTHPDVASRIDSAADFLGFLDAVEEELTSPDQATVENPARAQKGDLLAGGYTVLRRLGEGACSVVLLVERDGEESVLKVANSEEHNARLRDEAELLGKLHHAYIVKLCTTAEVGDRFAFLMEPVFAEKADRRIETLGLRLRKEGRLHVDLLQRFGEDLLEIVKYLEEQGIPHRDIKPDNIAVGMVGRGDKLHLVLFDFSLSRTPPENIKAGTQGYLDPLLPLRKRWDLYAERYAAAVTLFELATGTMPKWGDGRSEPSQVECEATIDEELFDPALREALVPFFRKALRRDARQRHDNAEDMLRAWRDCFAAIEAADAAAEADEAELRQRLEGATFDSSVHELGLGTRATNALDRANVLTVEDLLTVQMRRLLRLRGVGNKTRREIAAAVKLLREHLGNPPDAGRAVVAEEPDEQPAGDPSRMSVDLLAQRLTRTGPRDGDTARQTITALLGLEEALPGSWPAQADVARFLSVSRARVGQIVSKVVDRWAGKEKGLTRLREDITGLLAAAGGVMTAVELGEAILAARGSVLEEPQRSRLARAVARAAVETERTMSEPRYMVRRDDDRALVALHPSLADYAARLGDRADDLAAEACDNTLAPPARALQVLRAVPSPAGFEPLSDSRLLRLAAAASRGAAVSSRQEIYPRGMEALRALKLAQGALGGVRVLSAQQVRDRVAGRYPEADPLPDRPRLDELLTAAGVELAWDADAVDGRGGYVNLLRDRSSIPTPSVTSQRQPTSAGRDPREPITPQEAEARQFEEKLRRSLREGAFLTLLVPPRAYQQARRELERRFPLQAVDGDRVIIDALREAAVKARVDWPLVLRTDAAPHNGDWKKLMLLVGRAMPRVEERLSAVGSTVLLVHAGLLARYDKLDLLERLRDRVGRPGGPPGLWLLLPAQQPLIDGKAVPLLSPAQRVHVPESWIENRHRAAPPKEARS